MAGGRGVREGWEWGKEEKGNRMRREVEMGQGEGWKMEMGRGRGQKWGESRMEIQKEGEWKWGNNGARTRWQWDAGRDRNGVSRTEMGQGGRWEWGKGGKKWDKERGGNGVRKKMEMG